MALSTPISGSRPRLRSARVPHEAFQGCVALDWANGQALVLTGTSGQSTAFDAVNDRIVLCSVGGASTVGGCWVAVGTNPIASAGAGSMWISQQKGVAVYVPAGMLIAGVQGQTGGTLSLIPALISSDP